MKNHRVLVAICISALTSCATDPQHSELGLETYGDLCGRMYGEQINRASMNIYDVESITLPDLENKYFSSLPEEEMFRYLISKTVESRLEGEKMINFVELVKTYKRFHGKDRLINFINERKDDSFDRVQVVIGGNRLNSIENLRSAFQHVDSL